MPTPSRLYFNQKLTSTNGITSPNQTYRLAVTNGHITLTRGTETLWSTRTRSIIGADGTVTFNFGPTSTNYACLTPDGKFVLWDTKVARVVWSNNRTAGPNPYIQLRDDGEFNLCDYTNIVKWSSLYLEDGLYMGQELRINEQVQSELSGLSLVLQSDGNLVAKVNGQVFWSSGTAGKPAAHATVTADGRFVIRDAQKNVIWTASDNGAPIVAGAGAYVSLSQERVFALRKKGSAMYAQDGAIAWRVWLPEEPIGGSPGCFAGGTPIAMADGSTTPIERVRVGDMVLAFDTDELRLTKRPVTAFHTHPPERVRRLQIEGSGDEIQVTGAHRVYSGGTWLPVAKLPQGATVSALQGEGQGAVSPRSVLRNEETDVEVPVYNLSVEQDTNYFAAGVLVHNVKA